MLTITYIPVISEDFAAQLEDGARQVDAAAKVVGKDPGPQGAVEWALPAVVAFVVGGLSTAVLSELGKDIYKGLKALVVEAYDEASKAPYEWHVRRKEPTLKDPEQVSERQAAEEDITSPPVKITVQVEEWGGQLSFIFYKGLTSEQVADGYAAIGDTIRTILSYSNYLYAQLKSKTDRPELYQGSMPDHIWEERLQYEVHEASSLLHAVFVFDAAARVWGRVH